MLAGRFEMPFRSGQRCLAASGYRYPLCAFLGTMSAI